MYLTASEIMQGLAFAFVLGNVVGVALGSYWTVASYDNKKRDD